MRSLQGAALSAHPGSVRLAGGPRQVGLPGRPASARRAVGAASVASTTTPGAGRPAGGQRRPTPVAAVDSAAATTAPTAPTAPAPPSSAFTWRSAWYPVALASSLDSAAPAQVTLLGTEVVLWHAPPSPGEPAAWNAALDVCPHRLAALSSGRLEDGILTCRYHGWAFSGDGSCVANPQAADAKAEATVCGSARARLASLPCRVEQGLVWVWPTPGRSGAAAAASTPLPLYPETSGADSATYPGSAGEWGFQVAPVDWSLMTENSLDPSHAPFLHEAVMGPNTRAGAAPCVMRLDPPGLTDTGFTVSHGGYTKKQIAEKMVGKREFTAPGRLRAEYTFDDGRQAIAVLYFTPTKPGFTSTFGKFYQKPAPGAAGTGDASWAGHGGRRPSLAARFRGWAFAKLASSALFHALSHSLVDQDNAVLHPIGARLAAAPTGWRAYWLATPADAGVGAFHRFLSDKAGGGPDWDPRAPPAPALTRAALLDHYERHTRHCPTCLAAVARLDWAAAVLTAVVWGAGLVGAAAAVVAFAAVPGSVSPGRLAGAGGGAVVVGVATALARKAVLGLRQQFFGADKLADE